ncbi:hypothetical protein JR316_0010432 [Psilocybe cubensis]|uniref:Uncharacterized protein n=2 Tax=Psilocybe cubensis TaxID=181762 RepID=A0ACB8GM22_PSICU|nr:hypothetical protein JR316_0010432 [Psilocybe cubensis]KAH9476520.1 hypothetical protein JR316_0010432 [Psilocybe cubensis]
MTVSKAEFYPGFHKSQILEINSTLNSRMLSTRFSKLNLTVFIALSLVLIHNTGAVAAPIPEPAVAQSLTLAASRAQDAEAWSWPWATTDEDPLADDQSQSQQSHGVLLRRQDDGESGENGIADAREIEDIEEDAKTKPSSRKSTDRSNSKDKSEKSKDKLDKKSDKEKPTSKSKSKSKGKGSSKSDESKGGLDLSDPFEDLKAGASIASIADIASDALPEAAELLALREEDKSKPKKSDKSSKSDRQSKDSKEQKTKKLSSKTTSSSKGSVDEDISIGGVDLSNPVKDLEGVSDIGEIGKFASTLFGRDTGEEDKRKKGKNVMKVDEEMKVLKKHKKLEKEVVDEAPMDATASAQSNAGTDVAIGGTTIATIKNITPDNGDDDSA